MECSVSGCIRGPFRKGLCSAHYAQERLKLAGPCKVEGCGAPQHANGLCNTHYRAEKLKTAPKCAVEGCGRGTVANGLCNSHNQRKRRRGHLDPTRPHDWGTKTKHPLAHTWAWQMRGSTNAGVEPEWRDFWRFVDDVGERPSPHHRLRRRDLSRPLGPENFEWREPVPMAEAATPSERRSAYMRDYMRRNPQNRVRSNAFRARYGIGAEEYDAMLSGQRGVCAICERPERSLNQYTHEPRRLAVDHCHDTRKIRGLLCKACNTAIGALEENPALFRSALRYLKKHKILSDES